MFTKQTLPPKCLTAFGSRIATREKERRNGRCLGPLSRVRLTDHLGTHLGIVSGTRIKLFTGYQP